MTYDSWKLDNPWDEADRRQHRYGGRRTECDCCGAYTNDCIDCVACGIDTHMCAQCRGVHEPEYEHEDKPERLEAQREYWADR